VDALEAQMVRMAEALEQIRKGQRQGTRPRGPSSPSTPPKR
jgi:hypothetical protein